MKEYAAFLDALEEHTKATINMMNNEDNPDTRNGRADKENAEAQLRYARMALADAHSKLSL